MAATDLCQCCGDGGPLFSCKFGLLLRPRTRHSGVGALRAHVAELRFQSGDSGARSLHFPCQGRRMRGHVGQARHRLPLSRRVDGTHYSRHGRLRGVEAGAGVLAVVHGTHGSTHQQVIGQCLVHRRAFGFTVVLHFDCTLGRR